MEMWEGILDGHTKNACDVHAFPRANCEQDWCMPHRSYVALVLSDESQVEESNRVCPKIGRLSMCRLCDRSWRIPVPSVDENKVHASIARARQKTRAFEQHSEMDPVTISANDSAPLMVSTNTLEWIRSQSLMITRRI